MSVPSVGLEATTLRSRASKAPLISPFSFLKSFSVLLQTSAAYLDRKSLLVSIKDSGSTHIQNIWIGLQGHFLL